MSRSPLKAHVIIVEQESQNGLEIVRPIPQTNNSNIINKLINKYGDEPNYYKPSLEKVDLLRTAFPNVADEILKTNYDGSDLIADNTQDLVGEKYLEQQIKKVNEENRKKSILDSYNYMLYEGDHTRRLENKVYPIDERDLTQIKPIKTTYFKLSDLTF